MTEAVYGQPPPALAGVAGDAAQLSPLIPGAVAIEDLPDGSLAKVTVAAPPGTLERRYVLAHVLRALRADGDLVVLAPKTLGGARLRGELEAFGCEISERSRHHHRICQMRRPDTLRQVAEAITAGGPQRVPSLGLWSQPGLFSWDRLDPGSALLLAQPLRFEGAGVDLGCGAGVLARAALVHDAVTAMTLIDLDRRAMDAARRNLDDPRAHFLQHDLRRPPRGLTGLDFAVMNPPFHDGGVEDRALGRAFAAAAAAMLRAGGRLVMVANVALPFENLLAESFASVRNLARVGGYKVLEANR